MADHELQLLPDEQQILTSLQRQTCRWHELEAPCWLEVRMFRAGMDDAPLIQKYRAEDAGLKLAAECICDWNAKDRNVYTVRNPVADSCGGAATDGDIIAAFAAFADCDSEEAAANLINFVGPKYSYAVVTGTIPHPRPHPYWEFAEPVTDMDAWRDLQKRIAARIGSDPVVHNPSRIMRVAGTITWPDARKRERGYVSEIATIRTDYIDVDQRGPIPFEQLQRAFPPAGPTQTATGNVFDDLNTTLKTVDRQAAITAALSGQEWHNNVIRAVASYVSKGLSDPEIHAITDNLTIDGYTVDQTRAEVQKAINGARAKGWAPEVYANPAVVAPPEVQPQAAENAPETPAPDSAVEWFDDIEPALNDSYIIKSVIGEGAMSVIYGASNSGKTFFTLDLAYHVAINADWRSHRVNGGSVLYLAAEGGRGMLNRVAALKVTHGVCDVPLAVKRAGLDLLRSNADLQSIVDLAAHVGQRAPLKLIVIDTLSRVMAGGDENSASDMTALIRNLDAVREMTKAHIMLVHHSGKDAAKGARGHSSLRAATDTEIEVEDVDGDRTAYARKQRDYSGGEAFAFTLKSVDLGADNDGDQVGSCVVEEADTDASMRPKRIGGIQKIILECFDILVGDGDAFLNPGGAGMPEPGRFWCVDFDRLRALAIGRIPARNPEKSFYHSVRSLVSDHGLLCRNSEIVWRTDRPKKDGTSMG